MFAGKKSAQIREILISESAWEEMTCLFAPSLGAITDTKRHIRIKIQQLAICNYFQEVTPPTPVQNKSSPGDKNGDNYADGD